MVISNNLAARITELERLLESTRQQYMDADHGSRIWYAECRRLRSEASELMAENAGLIQANDALKQDKARLYQGREVLVEANDALTRQVAWHVENAKRQAEVIRTLETDIERLRAPLWRIQGGMIELVADTGQADLPPTVAEERTLMEAVNDMRASTKAARERGERIWSDPALEPTANEERDG